jgi:hypothetical protein
MKLTDWLTRLFWGKPRSPEEAAARNEALAIKRAGARAGLDNRLSERLKSGR